MAGGLFPGIPLLEFVSIGNYIGVRPNYLITLKNLTLWHTLPPYMEKSDKIIFTIIFLVVIGLIVFWSDVKTLFGSKSTNTEIKVEKDKKEKKKDKKKDKDNGAFNYPNNSFQA